MLSTVKETYPATGHLNGNNKTWQVLELLYCRYSWRIRIIYQALANAYWEQSGTISAVTPPPSAGVIIRGRQQTYSNTNSPSRLDRLRTRFLLSCTVVGTQPRASPLKPQPERGRGVAPLEAVGLEHGIEAVDGRCVHGLRGIDHVPDAGQVELGLVLHRHELTSGQPVREVGSLETGVRGTGKSRSGQGWNGKEREGISVR